MIYHGNIRLFSPLGKSGVCTSVTCHFFAFCQALYRRIEKNLVAIYDLNQKVKNLQKNFFSERTMLLNMTYISRSKIVTNSYATIINNDIDSDTSWSGTRTGSVYHTMINDGYGITECKYSKYDGYVSKVICSRIS